MRNDFLPAAFKAALLRELVLHFGEDLARVEHALQVLEHAEALLREIKEADATVVTAAAVMHDFGIREAERIHGRCDGPLQEKLGPPLVRKALLRIGLGEAKIRKICAIVARHHSPPHKPSINFKILSDSDWLVNIRAIGNLHDNPERLEAFIEKNFLTPAGKNRAYTEFLREDSIFSRMGNVYGLMVDDEKRRIMEEPYLMAIARKIIPERAATRRPSSGTGQAADRAAEILDLACGTGFHSRLFARRGYSVLAMDNSHSMLAEARRMTKDMAVVYRWGDLLKKQAIEEPVALAILLGNTLSIFRKTTELAKVFRNIAAALAPGGVLVTQMLNYRRMRNQPPFVVTKQGIVSGAHTVLTKSLQFISEEEVLLSFTASQLRGKHWHTEAESTLLHAWDTEEIIAAARKAGLRQRARWGSLTQEPFDMNKSSDSVLEFQKLPHP